MRRNRLLIAVVLLAIGAYFGYHYLYQDHRDIETEVAFLETNSQDLVDFFMQSSTPEVLNKTLQVTGIVTQIEGDEITLDDKIHCSFFDAPAKMSIGKKVVVKGRCIGYDDLFEIVKLDQSTVIN